MPEIFRGIVEIKSIAREAGYRSKVAVWSRQEGVDPVGACVGMRGIRIQNIVNELDGERIDVVQWDPEPSRFVANALSPAQVVSVVTNDDGEEHTAEVVVPDRQLSLAIGKEGQNARLAAKLTGWRIDIKSQTAYEEELAAQGLTLGDGRRDGARRGAQALEGARRAGRRRGAHRRADAAADAGRRDRARIRAARGSRQRAGRRGGSRCAAAVVPKRRRRPLPPASPGRPTIRFAEELVRPAARGAEAAGATQGRPAEQGRERRGSARRGRSRRRRAARAASCPSRRRKRKTTEYSDLIR